MKKLIALSMLAGSLAVPSVFGQGFMLLIQKSAVYDGFTTPGTSQLDANVDVALLLAASGTANPMPGALGNTLTAGNSATTSATAGYTDTAAWNDIYPSGSILSGWTLATDGGGADGNTAGTAIQVTTTSKGGVSYNGGVSFDVTGTSVSGNVALMLLSWNAAYSSPSAAAGAGSAIGWSYLSSYTMFAQTDPSIASPAFADFGTFIPATTVIPEPATLALAGLSGLSLLFLRRKKA